jgi:putative tryptophan/tyrosine transport system substrate-binding protein
LQQLAKRRFDGLVLMGARLMFLERQYIVEKLAALRLPAIYPDRNYSDAGGLISYGPNTLNQYRMAASFVDKILRGAKPADLPVEQPRQLELVINLKTAKALGLTIPPSLLLRADHVIE